MTTRWGLLGLAVLAALSAPVARADEVADFYRTDGRYGSWQWWTLAVFTLGILVQIPFISLSFFHGVVFRLTGADFSWLPGLLVSAGAYLAVHRVAARFS